MTQTAKGQLPPQTHKDVTIHLGQDTRGIVVLWRSSPFASCSLTTSPGPLARDLSPNVPALFTTLAGFGVSPAAVPLTSVADSIAPPSPASPKYAFMAEEAPGESVSQSERAAIRTQIQSRMEQEFQQARAANGAKAVRPPDFFDQVQRETQDEVNNRVLQSKRHQVESIEEEENAISKGLEGFKKSALIYNNIDPALRNMADIRKKLRYSYPDDTTARNAIGDILADATQIVGTPLPDPTKTVADLQSQLGKIVDAIAKLQEDYGTIIKVHLFIEDAQKQVEKSKQLITDASKPDFVAQVVYVNDTEAKVQKILDFVKDWIVQDQVRTQQAGKAYDATVQALPIAVYPEGKVGVTVKCVDAVTSTAYADGIQFNAYFQAPPRFDLSAGVLISFLPNQSFSVQTPYTNPTLSSTAPTCSSTTPEACANVIETRSKYQFVPGLFAEYHLINFKLPWARDPAYGDGKPPETINTWMSFKKSKKDDQHLNAPRHPFGYVGSFGPAGGILVNPNSGSAQAEFFFGASLGIQRIAILVGDHLGRVPYLTNGFSLTQPVAPGTTVTTANGWGNGVAVGITYRIPLR